MEQTPYWADLVFPVLSFCMTIVMPSCVALWVISRTVRDLIKPKDAPRKP